MNDLFSIILVMSITSSCLGLLVLLLKRLLRNKISSTWQYYIWIIIFIRLILPFNSPINIFADIQGKISQQTLTQSNTLNNTTITETSDKNEFSSNDVSNSALQQTILLQNGLRTIVNYVFLIMIIGSFVFAIKKIVGYNVIRRSVNISCFKVADKDIISKYCSICVKYSVKKPPRLYYLPNINTPVLMGIFRPKILLPTNIKGDIEHIFFHELTHFKRHDTLSKFLVQAILCIHWFNPIIWLFVHEVEKDCELSCDERVLYLLNNQRAYGDTLLATIRTENSSYLKNSLAFTKQSKFIKERLENIMKFKQKKSKKLAVLITIVIISVSIIFGYTIIAKGFEKTTIDSYVLKYKTDDYKNGSLYNFNQTIMNDYDAAYNSMGSFEETDIEKDYYTSFTLSLIETKSFLGKNDDKSINGSTVNLIEGNRRSDYLNFLYNIWWAVDDMQSITVAERDKTILDFKDSIIEIINRKIDEGAFNTINADDYSSVFAVVENDINIAAQSISTDTMTVGVYPTESSIVSDIVNSETWVNRYKDNAELDAVITILLDENLVSAK